MNPIFWLELRTRIAEKKLWLIALLFIVMMWVGILIPTSLFGNRSYQVPGETGSIMQGFILVLHAGLMALLGGISAASRISQEREQRTIAPLLNSPVSRLSIIFGKLFGSWIFLIWISCLTLPFLAVTALWGGFSAGTMIKIFISNTVLSLLLSAMALASSAQTGRTLTSYLFLGLVVFGWSCILPLLYLTQIAGNRTNSLDEYAFLFHNPLFPIIYLFSKNEMSWMQEVGGKLPLDPLLYCYLIWFFIGGLSILLARFAISKENV
ncbi:ABC transporter permease subunit [bacterium]|nr:ABC transporter permease subunit [bacterium]